jgi:hypothetical protein
MTALEMQRHSSTLYFCSDLFRPLVAIMIQLMPHWRDGLFHHHMLLQVLLMHLDQLLLRRVFLRLWSVLLLRHRSLLHPARRCALANGRAGLRIQYPLRSCTGETGLGLWGALYTTSQALHHGSSFIQVSASYRRLQRRLFWSWMEISLRVSWILNFHGSHISLIPISL